MKKWLQPGGHLEYDELPHQGALREVLEEVGLVPRIIDAGPCLELSVANKAEQQVPLPYVIFRELIPATANEDEHVHIDLIYLMEHEQQEPCSRAEYSNQHAQWFSLDQMRQIETFESIRKLSNALLR